MSTLPMTRLPVVDKEVARLGLACSFGIGPDDVRHALDQGVRYLFWTPMHRKVPTTAMKAILAERRDEVVLATGPTTGWFAGGIRRYVDKMLTKLGTDHIDVLQIYWVGVSSSYRDATADALVRLRESGKVRSIGISIHDRERAGSLAASSPLDLFMIRYNAAHPGAERDIFPHIDPKRHIVTAYTATRWRKLLKRPKGWEGEVMTAGDCYRWALANPNVNVVLNGPKTREQLDQNIAAVAKGPLGEDELAWMREFGRVVHG